MGDLPAKACLMTGGCMNTTIYVYTYVYIYIQSEMMVSTELGEQVLTAIVGLCNCQQLWDDNCSVRVDTFGKCVQ